MAGPSSLHFNKCLWNVDVEVDVDGGGGQTTDRSVSFSVTSCPL